MTIYEKNIPEELIRVPNWVGWQEVNIKGKLAKIPIDPVSRKLSWAKVNDPSTWSKFDDALKIYIQRKVDGIGFVFSKYDDFIGVDLDNCFDDDNRLTPKVRRMVKVLDSYTEISPSGKGLHIIVKSNYKQMLVGIRREGLEIYPTGRFFTITSHLFEDSITTISERHVEINAYINEAFDAPAKRIPANADTCPLCSQFERTGSHSKVCVRNLNK